MEWPAARILLLSGFLSRSWTSPEKIFHFVRDKMDWQSARNYCTENFVDLAPIADGSVLALLRGLVETGDQYVFVALKREWQWTVSDPEKQREAEIKFDMFEDGESREENDCGMIKPSGEWTPFKCTTDWPFICYNDNGEFVKEQGPLNWGKSRSFCKKKFTDLAKIQNKEENLRIVSLLNGTQAWIGLTKRVWSWADGTNAEFTPWIQGINTLSAGHHCAALRITAEEPLGIVPWDCNNALPFFCYSMARKKYMVRIVMSVESGVDPAGSADSVLKMVQSQLSERGFSKDVRLTWSKPPQKVNPAQKQKRPQCPLHIDP